MLNMYKAYSISFLNNKKKSFCQKQYLYKHVHLFLVLFLFVPIILKVYRVSLP